MRHRFHDENCSVAQTLEILGDWWTLLIIREAFLGTRRFADFQQHLEIAKNILSQRLRHLVDHGIFERVDVGTHGKRYEYVLSPKGKDLATILTALRQWGDRWIFGEGNEPLIVLDRRTNRPVPRVRILDEEGKPLRSSDMLVGPGPGANEDTVARAVAMLEQRAR